MLTLRGSTLPSSSTLQPVLTCQQCPQTSVLRPAPPAWRWAGTAWPATLFHTPSPSLSLCFGELPCGRKQSSLRRLSLICCHQTHMKSLLGWCAGHSGTGWAPTVHLQLSSPPMVQSRIWRLAGCLLDYVLSGYSKEHLWCCRACCTQSLEYLPEKQRPGSGSHMLWPGRQLQSTDMPETWRERKYSTLKYADTRAGLCWEHLKLSKPSSLYLKYIYSSWTAFDVVS